MNYIIKKLYDTLLSNISIYTKLDYIGKEEKHMLNQNITNGGLYKDWNFGVFRKLQTPPEIGSLRMISGEL